MKIVPKAPLCLLRIYVGVRKELPQQSGNLAQSNKLSISSSLVQME